MELLILETYRVIFLVLSSSIAAILWEHFFYITFEHVFMVNVYLCWTLICFLTLPSIGIVDIPLSRCRFLISRVVKIAVLAFLPVCTGSSFSWVLLVLGLGGGTDRTAENNQPKGCSRPCGITPSTWTRGKM